MSAQGAPEVLVKDVMSRKPITVKAADTVEVLAKRMSEAEVGSVIVLDSDDKPIGIVTERDLVKRIAAENLLASKVNGGQIMSAPLITIGPTTSIIDAARKMRQHKIRRLVVLDGGKMQGMLTSRDILDVTPALVDVLVERSKMNSEAPRERSHLAGNCDKCSTWSDNLRHIEGTYICDDCATDLEERT